MYEDCLCKQVTAQGFASARCALRSNCAIRRHKGFFCATHTSVRGAEDDLNLFGSKLHSATIIFVDAGVSLAKLRIELPSARTRDCHWRKDAHSRADLTIVDSTSKTHRFGSPCLGQISARKSIAVCWLGGLAQANEARVGSSALRTGELHP